MAEEEVGGVLVRVVTVRPRSETRGHRRVGVEGAMVGGEAYGVVPKVDSGVVMVEPWDNEYDWGTPEISDIELDGLVVALYGEADGDRVRVLA